MRQRRLITVAAPVLIGSLALAACGSKKEDPGGGGADKIVKLGFISPLSGDLSALGLGMRNSVDLAIQQANAAKRVKGWTIQLAAEDDTAKADVGATAATKLGSDQAVAGVVGTLNSSVAQQVQPILCAKNIVMVSPANTNPTLTQGDNPAAKQRKYGCYFRVATTDAIQGPFAAQYVSGTLKFTKVAIIHDKKTYGQGLQAAFAEEFKKGGGTIVKTETVNPGDKDFSAVISKVKSSGPQMVYYGGEYPEASLLSKQMKQKGLNVPLMGGDGIYDGTYIKNGGAQVNGDLATSVGAPTESLASAKSFIDAYQGGNYTEAYGAYGAQAYDAANVIINAFAKALDGKDKIDDAVRQAVIAEVQKTTLEGATGKVAFDEYGDTTTKILTVYKVVGAAWKPEKTDAFK